jgi:hypothetical protein
MDGGVRTHLIPDDTLMPALYSAELRGEREGEEVMIAGEQAPLHADLLAGREPDDRFAVEVVAGPWRVPVTVSGGR